VSAVAWEACTQEANQFIRWLECHLGTVTLIQGLLAALAVGFAALMPIWYERMKAHRAKVDAIRRVNGLIHRAKASFETALRPKTLPEFDAYANGVEREVLLKVIQDLDVASERETLPYELTHAIFDIRAGAAQMDHGIDEWKDNRAAGIMVGAPPKSVHDGASWGKESCKRFFKLARRYVPVEAPMLEH
jgi:hypothetical protein